MEGIIDSDLYSDSDNIDIRISLKKSYYEVLCSLISQTKTMHFPSFV